MTQLLPQNAREGRLLRRMRDTISETAPSESEIIRRLQGTRWRGSAGHPLWKRLAPLASGAVMGALLCGSALAWAFSTGRIVLPERAASPRTAASFRTAASPRAAASSTTAASFRTAASSSSAGPSPAAVLPRIAVLPGTTSSSASPAKTPEAPSSDAKNNALDLDLLVSPSQSNHNRPAASKRDTSQNAPVTSQSTSNGRSLRPDDDWVKVATQLRSGNYVAARDTLASLTHSEQPDAREAAEILDIQLRLRLTDKQLNDNDRARLTELARLGHSPSVRSSAARLVHNAEPTRETKSARD